MLYLALLEEKEILMEQALLWVLGLGLTLSLCLWMQKAKGSYLSEYPKELEPHYLDLRKDSRLAQEKSLQSLHQKATEKDLP
jgi:hypothetical protein